MYKTLMPLSVIICTYNRAGFLMQLLDSLTSQTLSKDDFEIIIIDDGSSDHTSYMANSFMSALPIKYFYQNHAGIASSRNHGIYTAKGEILLFIDDDDIATTTLIEEHIKTHRRYTGGNYAVLNYTTWASSIFVTLLMHFINEIGCFQFSYPYIKHGDILDYTYFWGGRLSCKKSFLIEYGVFNTIFQFGCEDIELGYRLAKHGLKVVYNCKAVSKMVRPVSFDDFCKRLIQQGRSQYVFSTLHNDIEIRTWTEVLDAEEKWHNIRADYAAKIRSAKELDKIVNLKLKHKFELDDLTKRLLHSAYWWAFRACKIKGIMEAKEAMQD